MVEMQAGGEMAGGGRTTVVYGGVMVQEGMACSRWCSGGGVGTGRLSEKMCGRWCNLGGETGSAGAGGTAAVWQQVVVAAVQARWQGGVRWRRAVAQSRTVVMQPT